MIDAERQAKTYEFGGFRLDPKRRSFVRADGAPVPLTAKVFDALVYLVEHAGQLVSRDALTKALWPKTIVEENNLNVTISALRRALGEEAAAQRYIATVAGRGYQFVGDVRVVDAATEQHGAATEVEQRPRGQNIGLAAGAAILVAALGLIGYGARQGWWTTAATADGTGAASVGSVSRVSFVTTYAGREETPALSPDGTHVAFSWDGEGQNQDIYVLRLGAQTPLRLTQDSAPEHSPAWSPDGSQIAFLRQLDQWHADIVVIPALGGAERKLHTARPSLLAVSPAFGGPLITWSPDGSRLLFTSRTGDDEAVGTGYEFHLLSLDDGSVQPLPLAGDGYDTSPAFSADASRLAFARLDATAREAQLMVQELGPALEPRGAPQPVPGAWLESPRSPAWSPDGARLLFARGSRIFEWVPGSEPRAVHASAQWLYGLSVAWREGRPVAVASSFSGDSDIWALPVDPEARVAIGPPVLRVQSTARDWHPRFSPDGRRIAFTSWRNGGGDIFVADSDGRNPRQLSRFGASDPGMPRWSPDGTMLSFMAFAPDDEPHTYTVDLDEGLPKLLTHGAASGWSRDSQFLYITELGDVSRVVRYRRADGSREPVAIGAAAQESADGSRVLYTRSDQPGIFARSLEGDVAGNPEEHVVEDYAFPPSAGFQPVAGGFYYVSYGPDARARAVRFYDDALRAARDVAPLPADADAVWGLSVSPDGRELLLGAPSTGADIVQLEF
jgi:Tol biopolymer transport system component/DNA-binding winged helix-turn-helix (wHTH) protein